MKHKFSKILGVGLALALALSLVVMAVPVSAITAGVTTVAVAPSTINTAGQYTITIDTTDDLSQTNDDDIRIVFPEGTEVPNTYVDSSISINGTDVVEGAPIGVDVLVDDVTREFIIDVPGDVSASADVVVVFKIAAGIVNPISAGTTYTLLVSTSEEVDSVLSAQYAITEPEGPVDRYDDSVPMEYIASYTTISSAITAASPLDTLKVHADTYNEQVVIGTDITLESYDGAETTFIDGTGLNLENAGKIRGTNALVRLEVNGITFKGFTLQNYPEAVYNGAFISIAGADVTTTNEHETAGLEGCLVTENILTEARELVSGIFMAGGDSNIISYNEIDGTGDKSIELHSGAASTNNEITGNTITDSAQYGIYLYGIPWETVKSFAGTLISENEISGGIHGICLTYATGSDSSHIVIEDNYIHGVVTDEVDGDGEITDDAAGIEVAYESEYVDILRNVLDGNGTGIHVKTSENVVANYNDITGNDLGVDFDSTTPSISLDARYNYWNAIGGPSADPLAAAADQSTALGNGDIISTASDLIVLYNPWLSVSKVTVITEGIRFYGSDTLTLQAGWNTLSVPLELYDLGDSIAEIETMGDFLIDGTDGNYWGLIYEYDPVDGFVTPTATELTPCRGYYIKMRAASKFPVLYSNNLAPPAVDLTAGWNLIGSAFGIDKLGTSTWAAGASETGTHTGADDAAVMTDDTAAFIGSALVDLTIVNETDGCLGVITANTTDTVTVASLAGGTDNDWDTGDIYSILHAEAVMGIGAALDSIGDQVSVVISPSAPGQIGAPWSVIWDTEDTDNKMYTGEGYWVFMTDTGTLAGWEITPFYFNP